MININCRFKVSIFICVIEQHKPKQSGPKNCDFTLPFLKISSSTTLTSCPKAKNIIHLSESDLIIDHAFCTKFNQLLYFSPYC